MKKRINTILPLIALALVTVLLMTQPQHINAAEPECFEGLRTEEERDILEAELASMEVKNLAKISDQFPDPVMAEAIAHFLDKDVDDYITNIDVLETDQLNVNVPEGAVIKDITGISIFTNTIYLNINTAGLTDLSPELLEMPKIVTLALEYNNLSELPSYLKDMPCLKYIDLGSNNFSEVPKVLYEIDRLDLLYLDENNLTELPLELLSNKNLTWLGVNGNQITVFPAEFDQLDLKHLNLFDNTLTTITQKQYDVIINQSTFGNHLRNQQYRGKTDAGVSDLDHRIPMFSIFKIIANNEPTTWSTGVEVTLANPNGEVTNLDMSIFDLTNDEIVIPKQHLATIGDYELTVKINDGLVADSTYTQEFNITLNPNPIVPEVTPPVKPVDTGIATNYLFLGLLMVAGTFTLVKTSRTKTETH